MQFKNIFKFQKVCVQTKIEYVSWEIFCFIFEIKSRKPALNELLSYLELDL